ncbi:MAG: tetratricopeptide repeat protein [Magnetococcales bacterium]|nr:tetratricopeptide repeat protein [Magnetococcales bacterium]
MAARPHSPPPGLLIPHHSADAPFLEALTPHLEALRWEGWIHGWRATRVDGDGNPPEPLPGEVVLVLCGPGFAEAAGKGLDNLAGAVRRGRLISVTLRNAALPALLEGGADSPLTGGAVEVAQDLRERLSRLRPGPFDTALGPGAVLEEPMPTPPHNLPTFRRPFYGRAAAMAVLAEGRPGEVTVITGPDGVGKTRLALEYACRGLAEFKLVWWVRASVPEAMEEDLLALAALLGLDQGTIREQLIRLSEFFSENSGWLLVLDDAIEPRLLGTLLPQGGAGRLLVTTHEEAGWREVAQRILPLEPFTPGEAGGFFALRTGREVDSGMGQLAGRLDYMPVGLEMAAAYLCRSGIPPEIVTQSGLSDGITALWQLWAERLERECPLARVLLNLLVFLEPQGLPRALALGCRSHLIGVPHRLPIAPRGMVRVLETLAASGLICLDRETITIHPRLRHLVRASLSREQRKQHAEAALRLILDHFDRQWDMFETWRRPWHLAPMAAATARLAHSWDADVELVARVLTQAGSFYHQGVDYQRARELLGMALSLVEARLGPDHPAIAACANNLGAVLEDLGDLQGARAVLERAMRIDTSVQGADHPNVAIHASNLAAVLLELGETDAAVALFQRAIDIDARHLGSTHPNVAKHLHNLGQVFRNLENWDGARDCFLRAVTAYRTSMGPDHPETINCQDQLAHLPPR